MDGIVAFATSLSTERIDINLTTPFIEQWQPVNQTDSLIVILLHRPHIHLNGTTHPANPAGLPTCATPQGLRASRSILYTTLTCFKRCVLTKNCDCASMHAGTHKQLNIKGSSTNKTETQYIRQNTLDKIFFDNKTGQNILRLQISGQQLFGLKILSQNILDKIY